MDSPPLWHLSPVASPNCRHGDVNKEKKGFRGNTNMNEKEDRDCFGPKLTISCRQRKSFSYIEIVPQRIAADCEDNKMDSLWEDFDEGLTSRITSTEITTSARDTVGLGCVHQSLAMAKAGGTLNTTSKNKAGIVLIVKVLKKLFLLRNSQLKLKKNGKDRFSGYG